MSESNLVTLINWYTSFGRSKNPYEPPEQTEMALCGEVYGHCRLEDGERITTSSVKGSIGRIVRTENTTYRLVGRPDPGWISFLASRGLEVDLRDPIKWVDSVDNQMKVSNG